MKTRTLLFIISLFSASICCAAHHPGGGGGFARIAAPHGGGYHGGGAHISIPRLGRSFAISGSAIHHGRVIQPWHVHHGVNALHGGNGFSNRHFHHRSGHNGYYNYPYYPYAFPYYPYDYYYPDDSYPYVFYDEDDYNNYFYSEDDPIVDLILGILTNSVNQ